MTDYGHDLHFGVFIPPVATQTEQLLAAATEADVLGLDSVSIQDHPYQPTFLDTWTLLTTIAARTERLTVFPNVANLPLRNPAVLARSAASLDILSNGRVQLGLGAGAFWDAIEAMGGPRRSPKQAVEALEEAISIIRALWTNERTPKIEGAHYRLRGAKPGPFPTHDIGIWLGAYKQRMLQLTGRSADGWLPSASYASPEELPDMNRIIDDAAHGAGRDPREIRRLYNIGPDLLHVDRLTELALEQGISGFIAMVDLDDRRTLRRLAEDIAPAVRERVEAARVAPKRYDAPPATITQPLAEPPRADLGVTPTPPAAKVQHRGAVGRVHPSRSAGA